MSIGESDMKSVMIYEIATDFFVMQNDAMASAKAYRNRMFPELCSQISDDINFVNQQSSGSRNINIS